MRLLILFFVSILYSSTFSPYATIEKNTIQNNDLLGEWILDLRPTPEADPYYQSLIIKSQEDKTFSGTFYGSAIQETHLNNSWDKLYFAFQTSDASSEYYQSGYMVGDSIFGITYSPQRNFVMPWKGSRKLK
ncbi:MAG: hypothetical protein P1U56_18995 [Saprospiraceae bacterium]|nr:hypothetical protein [Saprospiraceae bacterium]